MPTIMKGFFASISICAAFSTSRGSGFVVTGTVNNSFGAMSALATASATLVGIER